MTFPAYSDYKDSGVEWLGKVPSHWGVDRLKASISSCRNGIWGDEAAGDENDIACIRVADFDRQKFEVTLNEPTIRNVGEKERTTRTVRKGDLLLEKSGGGEKQPVGCVVLYNDTTPAICSNFIAKVELANGMHSSFWRFVHAAAYSIRLNVGSINQTSGIQNLDQDRYFNERAPFPPLSEQRIIASFLEFQTLQIDSLIGEQEFLVKLLKEKRQAVISNSVSRGLNSNAQMKDSGIQWLGDVPVDWQVGGLTKFIGQVVDYRGKTPLKVDEGVFLVTARNIRNGRIDYEISKEYADAASLSSLLARGLPEVGDVLFTMEAPLGQVALVDRVDIGLAQRIVKFRGLPDLLRGDFLLYWLMSSFCQARLETLATGSTALGIKASKLGMIECLVPPLHEQQEIVLFIESELKRIDELVKHSESSIDLLKERRAALISAAVSGKIDVRNFLS